MKNIILLATLLFLSTILWGQSSVEIEKRPMNEEMRDAFVLKYDHKGLKEKEVEKQWEKFTKSFGAKAKKDKSTGIYFADDAEINSMSDNTVDIYMKLNTPNDKTRELVVWYDLGGLYLDRDGDKSRVSAGKDWMFSFLGHLNTLEKEELLDAEEDLLKDVKKENKKAEKSVKKIEKKISKLEKEIEKEKKNLQEAKTDLPAIQSRYEMQQEKVNQLKKEIKSMPKL